MEIPFLRDLAVILIVALGVVALLQRLGVPGIAGFILAGTLVGPLGLGLVHDRRQVEVLAEIGVVLLLFGIGVELQVGRFRPLWRPVLAAGTFQIGVTVALAAAAGGMLGLPENAAVFLGMIVAVSSTAIVLRGLEARGEVDAPHGRLTLGVLLLQDLCVIPMMLLIPLLAGTGGAGSSPAASAGSLLRAAAALAGIFLAARLLVPRALHGIARTGQRDLFILAVLLAALGTTWLLSAAGVSAALGAFLAGLVVAGSEYRHQAIGDLIPFRVVFTSLFFVSVGMLLDPGIVWRSPVRILSLLVAILLGKFAVVLLAAALLRLPLRVGVLAAVALAQAGEFSFFLLHAASGTLLLPPALVESLMPAIILSMLVTPLALAAGPGLAAGAARIRTLTRRLGVQAVEEVDAAASGWRDHVIIAGYGVAGQELARALRECGVGYVVVDLNAENVRRAARAGEPIYYGDVTSPEVLHHLGVTRAREVVLVVNDPAAAERGARAIRRIAGEVHVLVRSRYLGEVERLLAAGASEVVPAEIEAAAEVAARVLARHSIDPALARTQLGRIRARRGEGAPEPVIDSPA